MYSKCQSILTAASYCTTFGFKRSRVKVKVKVISINRNLCLHRAWASHCGVGGDQQFFLAFAFVTLITSQGLRVTGVVQKTSGG